MDNCCSNTVNQALFQAKSADLLEGNAKKTQTTEEAAKAAKEFEAMFVGQMLNLLFEGVSADPLFGEQASDDIYRSMLLDQYGKKMAESHSLGIADQVQSELLKLQEV